MPSLPMMLILHSRNSPAPLGPSFPFYTVLEHLSWPSSPPLAPCRHWFQIHVVKVTEMPTSQVQSRLSSPAFASSLGNNYSSGSSLHSPWPFPGAGDHFFPSRSCSLVLIAVPPLYCGSQCRTTPTLDSTYDTAPPQHRATFPTHLPHLRRLHDKPVFLLSKPKPTRLRWAGEDHHVSREWNSIPVKIGSLSKPDGLLYF